MKIIVCIKQVLDTRVPLVVNSSVMQKEPSPVYIMNPADRVALEKALEMKASLAGGEITAITAGPARAEQVLRMALASGADEAVHLKDEVFEVSDAYTTALALSKVVKELGYTVILCGNKSLDIGAGQVPAYLGKLVDVPQVTGVIQLEIISQERVRLWRRLERGKRQIVECPLPALFTIDPLAGQPRYVSEFALRQSVERGIRNLMLTDIGLTQTHVGSQASLIRVVSLSSPRPRPKKIYIPDGSMSASQRMSYLLSSGLAKGKESNLLEGRADYLAKQVIEYLVEEGMLPKQLAALEPDG